MNHPTSPSVDIFITYRCGLRCEHCFVGDRLDSRTDMPVSTLREIILASRDWQTTQITFLGGEPTLHPKLGECVALAQSAGLEARIVTNGQHGYARFLTRFRGDTKPLICFSVDGSSEVIHDSIRGGGTFRQLTESIRRSKAGGYRYSGILSISTSNSSDVGPTLRLCQELGMEYVNIHHVTNRGFAGESLVPTPEQWLEITAEVETTAVELELPIRLERAFVPLQIATLQCAVRERTNLMFLPDGRVHSCMLFIDVPDAHSYSWTPIGLMPNAAASNEQHLADKEMSPGCPALHHINPSLSAHLATLQMVGHCVYDKRPLGRRAPH